ncbi:MAG: hypothetical protein UR15_C0005G0004 [Parcubacteria group bacterium GW2011_GWA2_31_28]|nr:MAG: hypothetical protein UR15_C0005G0004 [Parcubacteria group bacterium GW2011_GWA2_31_28]
MSLDDIQKNIYRKNPRFSDRPQGEINSSPKNYQYVKMKKNRKSFLGNYIWILIIVLFVLAGGIFSVFYGLTSFNENNIDIVIEGLKEISSGEQISYKVLIKNNNRLTLESAVLDFQYPIGSIPINDSFLVDDKSSQIVIGNIESKQELDREFKMRVMGGENEEKHINVILTYTPSGINSALKKQISFTSVIKSVPLIMEIESPKELKAGDQAFWNISIANNSDFDFEDLNLIINYPLGFIFDSALPASYFQDKIWNIKSIPSNSVYKISIKGSVTGQNNALKILEFSLGKGEFNQQNIVFTQEISSTRISSSPIALILSLNDNFNYNANIGDTLNYKIFYKNNLNISLDNSKLEVKLIGNVFDLESFEGSGKLNKENQTITFSSDNIYAFKNITPNEEGNINFKIKLKNALSISNFNDKNFTAKALATLSATDVPKNYNKQDVTQTAELVSRINTEAKILTELSFSGKEFTNTGPYPPQANKQTTYNIFWRIINTYNDIKDVEVFAYLPDWVVWTGNFSSDSGGEIYFDNKTNKVTWNLLKVPATTGVALPIYEITFQISLEPSNEHIGKSINVIGESQLGAIDEFTQEQILFSAPPLDLTSNGKIKNIYSKVQP